jgi:endonuclease/exonuclease/phosphatase family metal-dependent hydrolase
MKFATLNIDWAEKYKSAIHYKKIEQFIDQQDFDFLVLTEAIDLNLSSFKYKYFSDQIPENTIYERLNYTDYLKGEAAFRTIIYSKIPCVNRFNVNDGKTSLALEFETYLGNIIIYATIIGTWFKKQPFAKKELENCIDDCEKIYALNKNLFIVGDLNTSFLESEKLFSINAETTELLKNLFERCNLANTTEVFEENIDHIIIPNHFLSNMIESKVFVEKGILSDHKGIVIILK